MHSTLAFVLALAFGVSQAVAQTNLTAAFNLVVSSTNKTLDGTFLGACHEGAAFEGLCPSAPNAALPYEQYKLNYTASAPTDPVLGITGQLVRYPPKISRKCHEFDCTTICGTSYLSMFLVMNHFPKLTHLQTWLLQAVNVNVSSPLSIRADITTNVAVPEFVPDLGSEYPITYIGFDKDGKLFVPQYKDDTVVPAK